MKIIKNVDSVAHTYAGQEILVGNEYTIQTIEEIKMASDDDLLADIASLKAVINNGSSDILGVSNQIDYLKSNLSKEVTTQMEKSDKDLVLASDMQPFIGNICTLQVLVPGAPGVVGSRLIAGGYGFTNVFGWNDRVSKVQLLDKDYVYAGSLYPAEAAPGVTWADAMPLGVELGSYTDDDLPEAYRGWRLWCDDGNQGGIDIDPLGGFGKLLSLCYLTITVEKTNTSGATHAALNVWWGRPSV